MKGLPIKPVLRFELVNVLSRLRWGENLDRNISPATLWRWVDLLGFDCRYSRSFHLKHVLPLAFLAKLLNQGCSQPEAITQTNELIKVITASDQMIEVNSEYGNQLLREVSQLLTQGTIVSGTRRTKTVRPEQTN